MPTGNFRRQDAWSSYRVRSEHKRTPSMDSERSIFCSRWQWCFGEPTCARTLSGIVLAVIAATFTTACCPTGNCDYAFRPNWEGRHKAFVENLNASVGKPFKDQCLSEHACPPANLESGLIRYTAVDYRPWMKGCAFWFDVDPTSKIVTAVGFKGNERQCSVLNLE